MKVGNRGNSESKKHRVGAGRSQAEFSVNLKKSEECLLPGPQGDLLMRGCCYISQKNKN